MNADTRRWGIGHYTNAPIEGFTGGPFTSLREAMQEQGRSLLAIFETDVGCEPKIVKMWIEENAGGHWHEPTALDVQSAELGQAEALHERDRRMAAAKPQKKNFAAAELPAATADVPGQEEIPFGQRQDQRRPAPPTQTRAVAPPRAAPPAAPTRTATPPAGNGDRVHTKGAPPQVAEGETRDVAVGEAARGGDTVFVCVGKSINIGNYESIRVDIGRCRALKDGEDFAAVQDEVLAEVVAKVQEVEAEVLASVQS